MKNSVLTITASVVAGSLHLSKTESESLHLSKTEPESLHVSESEQLMSGIPISQQQSSIPFQLVKREGSASLSADTTPGAKSRNLTPGDLYTPAFITSSDTPLNYHMFGINTPSLMINTPKRKKLSEFDILNEAFQRSNR